VEISPFLLILVLGLATWRVSTIIAYEDDPFGILTKIREATNLEWFDEHDRFLSVRTGDSIWRERIGDLVSCLHCISVWIGIAYTVIAFLSAEVALAFSLPFALSAVAVIIKEVMDYGESDNTNSSLLG
jgi:hypothetical protein